MKNELYSSTRYLPFGDSALVVEFSSSISRKANQKVVTLASVLRQAGLDGLEELVPTYRSLLVRYDPLKIDVDLLVSMIKHLQKGLNSLKPSSRSRSFTVPVVYGRKYGPDLSYVGEVHGLTEDEVIKKHTENGYRVYMIGFVAGFPYLGEVPDEIATPRLETPRLKLPAGSVGIAEKQTGIYPREAPGGWRIIGRTAIKLFDPRLEPPALLSPGDTVRFRSVSEEEYISSAGG
jgi:KipI family sensor histidine kinase inhibitor